MQISEKRTDSGMKKSVKRPDGGDMPEVLKEQEIQSGWRRISKGKNSLR